MKNPTVFISYSWDNSQHKNWVIALANELRKYGIDAIVDEFITQNETVNLNRMMIENIFNNDFTLVIMTDKYAKKANEFKGGVGYETAILINDMVDNIGKIIQIMRFKGDRKEAIPYYLKGVSYIDFTNDSDFDEKFEDLKYKILKVNRIEMEPLGEITSLKPRKITRETIKINNDINGDLIPNFREITDRDKYRFMKESYSEIIMHLTEFAEQTKQKNNNFDFEVDVVNNKKSIIRFYINDMEKRSVKIWLDSKFSQQENILLSYDSYGIDSDNSCNEMIMCDVNKDKELKLKMMMNMFGNRGETDTNGVAVEVWKQILQYLK